MAPITVGARLHKGGMRIFPNRNDNLGQFVAHLAKIHAVDDFAGNVVSLGAVDNLLERCRSLHRSSHGEKVVLADENNRQLVERR